MTVMRDGQQIEYIEATLEDVAIANTLAHEVLGRSLSELTSQTRRVLEAIEGMVREMSEAQGIAQEHCRFTARQVRERTGLSHEQVRIHVNRLVDLEYVLVHRGSRGQSYVYELIYDGGGKDGGPSSWGLIDVERLKEARASYDGEVAGRKRRLAGGRRRPAGAKQAPDWPWTGADPDPREWRQWRVPQGSCRVDVPRTAGNAHRRAPAGLPSHVAAGRKGNGVQPGVE
jgi:hypothetical protein